MIKNEAQHASIPHLEPERIIDNDTKTIARIARNFTRTFSCLTRHRERGKGNSNDWISAYPDGLSKVPVIRKSECEGIMKKNCNMACKDSIKHRTESPIAKRRERKHSYNVQTQHLIRQQNMNNSNNAIIVTQNLGSLYMS